MPATNSVELQYQLEEPLPCRAQSTIYPWMQGFVLLRANPYMAKTNASGRFEIRNIPTGQHTFRIWHERVGYLREEHLDSSKQPGGSKHHVTIQTGVNDLGKFLLESRLFQREP